MSAEGVSNRRGKQVEIEPAWEEPRVLAYLAENDDPDWVTLQELPAFDHGWVVYFLQRERFIPLEVIRSIYRNKPLMHSYAVNRAMVRCRYTPVGIAANLLRLLRWLDLLHCLKEPYLSGNLKHRIERQIVERFPKMALGEKITLSKQAPRGLIRHLRMVPDRMVIKALMSNYFFTMDDALFLANYPRIKPDILLELASNARWTQHKQVRLDLLANPKLPPSAVKSLIRGFTEFDMRRLMGRVCLGPSVRGQLTRILANKPQP